MAHREILNVNFWLIFGFYLEKHTSESERALLRSMLYYGDWGDCRGVSLKVHDHLHCFKRDQLQVVKTAPDSQLHNFLSVSRLVTSVGHVTL